MARLPQRRRRPIRRQMEMPQPLEQHDAFAVMDEYQFVSGPPRLMKKMLGFTDERSPIPVPEEFSYDAILQIITNYDTDLWERVTNEANERRNKEVLKRAKRENMEVPYDALAKDPFAWGLKIQHFKNCCGGVEVGGFDVAPGVMMQTLTKLYQMESGYKLRSELGEDNVWRLYTEGYTIWLDKAMHWFLVEMGYRNYSTIIATTVPKYYGRTPKNTQEIGADALRKHGFEVVYTARNKGQNLVDTWIYKGEQVKTSDELGDDE